MAEYLGKRIQAPQERTSKAALEADTGKILITLMGTWETISVTEPFNPVEEKMTMNEKSKAFHIYIT